MDSSCIRVLDLKLLTLAMLRKRGLLGDYSGLSQYLEARGPRLANKKESKNTEEPQPRTHYNKQVCMTSGLCSHNVFIFRSPERIHLIGPF